MRKALILVAILALALAASSAMAASWILPIHHRDGGGWTELPGAGYGGSSAWQASGPDGVRRIYWSLEGSGVPTGTFLYSIEFYAPTQGAGNWQPIESQFNGSAGENWPIEPGIPWAGAYGTNHQWIGSEFTPDKAGTWVTTGPGPHTPESADYNAGPNGTWMWLKENSWLYAKWDFPWSIDRSWSALRITIIPEPGTFVALASGLVGLAGFAIRRRK